MDRTDNCHAQTELSSIVSANLRANLSKYFSNNYQRLLFSRVIALVSAVSSWRDCRRVRLTSGCSLVNTVREALCAARVESTIVVQRAS